MGYFYSRNNPPALSPVSLDLDPTDLTNLGCTKTPEIFLRDFVNRSSAIAGLVRFTKVGSSGSKGGRLQFQLEFEPADLVGLPGLALSWTDCDTLFTHFKLQGGTTNYFLLQVYRSGHLPTAMPVAVPLLI
jgi:hypothetical protein